MRTHIFPATLCVAMLACIGAVLAAISGDGLAQGYPEAALARQAWSDEEKVLLASMHIDRLPPPPADPSNAVAARPEAVALGQRLFHDTGMSANGRVSCATCHVPDRQFQDGLPVGRGVGTRQGPAAHRSFGARYPHIAAFLRSLSGNVRQRSAS